MALRDFQDSSGIEWQVWNVVPPPSRREERRWFVRRSPDPLLGMSGQDRRKGRDRRENRPRPFLPPLQEWLAFQSPAGRRRLTPVPEGWEELPDSDLEALCERAQVVDRNEGGV